MSSAPHKKVSIVSDYYEQAKALLTPFGSFFEVVTEDPEIVISYGGDGTFFRSEFLYPGVPKVYLKHSRIGKLAHKKDNEAILRHIVLGEYTVESRTKLDVLASGKALTAFGDILVHNKNPRAGIRCIVEIDGERLQEEDIIGDGLLIATQVGSTGYYKSITRSYFESDEQIGLAFNNAIEQINHVVLKKERVITVTVTRGPVEVFADNQEESLLLEKGEVMLVKASQDKALVLAFPDTAPFVNYS